MNVSTQAETEFALSPLCSVWSLGRLDDVHSYWEGSSALLRPPIQMLISPGNTLTDIPRSNVLLAIWASLSPVKLTHKSNHHSELSSGWELKRGRERVRQRELYFFKCILNIYLYLFYLDVLGLSCDMLGLFPDQGSDPGPLYWELKDLATGPPGKSQEFYFHLMIFFDPCLVLMIEWTWTQNSFCVEGNLNLIINHLWQNDTYLM